jgi:hypothetical protein
MCDYSLIGLRSRLAIEGEWLITYRFPTGSIGLASRTEVQPEEADHGEGVRNHRSWWSALKDYLGAFRQSRDVGAVCIPPGARLRMYCWPAPELRNFQIRPVMDVVFAQLSAVEYQYRDAVDLRNGRTILLQRLPEGVHFEVLSMGSEELPSGPEVTQTAKILAEFDRENSLYGNAW